MTPMRIAPKLGKQGMVGMNKTKCDDERTVRVVYRRRLVHCTASGRDEKRREEAKVMQALPRLRSYIGRRRNIVILDH